MIRTIGRLGALTALGAATAASAQIPAVPAQPMPQAIAADVSLIPGGFLPNRQPDGNTIVFEGPKGLVVMDTGRHRWHRQAILDFAKTRRKPIAAIVNSHWHLDHVSGNPDLKAAYPGSRVYASDAIDGALSGFLKDSAAGARDYLRTGNPPPETAEDINGDLASIENGAALKPDVVVAKTETLTLGGRKLELHLARNGPTAGDIWVYDAATKTVATGDLVTYPVPFLDTACVAGWKAALADISATPFEIAIPGHGKPMTRAQFSLYRQAFDNFVDCANSSRDKAECTAGWVKGAGPLLAVNAVDAKRAEDMADYYVGAVLRPNGGNSKSCKTG
ncbi:MAG: MBL fold metallo-hydrolase [Caulobacteraceae bacterium]